MMMEKETSPEKKETLENKAVTPESDYFSGPHFLHLLKHSQLYLISLFLILFMITAASSFWLDKPLLLGGESYYHLSLAQEIKWSNFYYYPLHLISTFLPEDMMIVVPLLLALGSILMFYRLSRRLNFSERFTFVYLALLIISPVFIFTFITLSAYSLFLFLLLLGFVLFSSDKKWVNYFSIIPFAMIAFIDFYSTIFLIMLQITYSYPFLRDKSIEKKNLKVPKIIVLCLTIISLGVSRVFWKIPGTLGPFHLQQKLPDLISDFGGLNGFSLFALLLALIGIAIAWKKKNYSFAYFFLPLIIPLYFYNTQTSFHLFLVMIIFSAVAIIRIFERPWSIEILKKFTILVILLGLAFSTITYLERITKTGPTSGDVESLNWVKENIPELQVMFSAPENSYFIRYFAQKEPWYQLHQKNPEKANLTRIILQSTYTSTTFPILEENKISLLYLTSEMRKKYPSDRGLFFLLQNEKFKLVHSNENSEIWVFEKKKE